MKPCRLINQSTKVLTMFPLLTSTVITQFSVIEGFYMLNITSLHATPNTCLFRDWNSEATLLQNFNKCFVMISCIIHLAMDERCET